MAAAGCRAALACLLILPSLPDVAPFEWLSHLLSSGPISHGDEALTEEPRVRPAASSIIFPAPPDSSARSPHRPLLLTGLGSSPMSPVSSGPPMFPLFTQQLSLGRRLSLRSRAYLDGHIMTVPAHTRRAPKSPTWLFKSRLTLFFYYQLTRPRRDGPREEGRAADVKRREKGERNREDKS